MFVAKETGGVTIARKGKRYAWKNDGDVTHVPDDWGLELLAIRGGGFTEAEAPAKPAAKEKGGGSGEQPPAGGDGAKGAKPTA